MRLSFPSGARQYPVDRAPQYFRLEYIGGNVAPHSSTIRATQFITGTRRACITNVLIEITRQTAAATLGRVMVRIATRISGTLDTNIVYLFHMNNTVGSFVSDVFPVTVWLDSGGIIDIVTKDLSSGGTMEYDVRLVGYMYER